MRRILAAVLSWLLIIAPSEALVGAGAAHAGLRLHGSVAGACADDGHTGAPTGGQRLYSSRRAVWTALAGAGGIAPPCQVPDVDYPVGPDNNCSGCVDPSTATLPTGVTWNATQHRIDCAGAPSGTVIENYNTALVPGGSGTILINGCDNVTIRNVKIATNCNDPTHQGFPIRQLSNSTNITITKVSVDQGGLASAGCANQGEAIYLNGAGSQSITYTRVMGATQHNVTFACSTGISCTAYERYNSLSALGSEQGSHDNGVQWLNNFASSDVSYNLWYNPQPTDPDIARPACYGPQTCTNNPNGSPGTVTIGNSQLVMRVDDTNQMSFLVDEQITGTGFTGTKYICALTDYIGPAIGPDYVLITLSSVQGSCGSPVTTTTSTGTAQVLNAFPIGLVNAIRYANQGTPTGQMLNGTFTGNVLDGDGPIKPGTNAFSCGGDSTGKEINGMALVSNYWNPSGYQGGFFLQAAYCLNASGSGNKNMVTGATVSVP